MKFFHYRASWSLFGILILLTSCVSVGKISIQVAVPPKLAVPNEIQSLVIMNRSMNDEFANYNQDSLEALFVKKKLALDSVFLDSVACDTTLQALGNYLFQSGRYDVVIPVRRNIPNNNPSYKDQSASLTLGQVRQICTEFKVDALLLLENFHEKVNTAFKMSAGAIYSGDFSVNETYAYVQVAYHSNWKLYQPLEKLYMAKFEVQDTIFWDGYGATLQETYEKLPLIKEALIGGAIENGQNLAAYISPGWKSDVRTYFITGNEDADKAIPLLKKNEWKEAETIWMRHANSGSASLRSKIEFNLALAAEMNGNLEDALLWVAKSSKSNYSKAAEHYEQVLNKRLAGN